MAACWKCNAEIGVCSECPRCGAHAANNPTIAIAFCILVVIVAVFLMPAILVLWPFQVSFGDAFSVAVHSVWGWLGSAAFWGVVTYLIYTNWNKEESNRPKGRQFNCHNCGQAVVEITMGDLNNPGGVTCPYCHANNVLRA